MAIAEDLARARGIDLASATDIMIKAHEGNVGALKKLGIIVPTVTTNVDALKASTKDFTPEQLAAAEAADKQATATSALEAIQKSAQGQAAAYAGTMQGKFAIATATVKDAQEKLGTVLNNVAAAVLPTLMDGLSSLTEGLGTVVDAAAPIATDVVGAFEAMKPTITTIATAVVDFAKRVLQIGRAHV